jgi:hypothetical protein
LPLSQSKLLKNNHLEERSFGQLKLGQFDSGSEINLIEHALEHLAGEAFAPFGDRVGQPA